MKRLALAVVLLLVSGASAYSATVPSPTDVATAGASGAASSSGASAAVSEEGTLWEAEVSMDGRRNAPANDSIELSKQENMIEFNSSIQAPTPCHVLRHDAEETQEDEYILDVQTVKENSSRLCAQQVVTIDYTGSFSAEPPYSLKLRHDGGSVRSTTVKAWTLQSGTARLEQTRNEAADHDFLMELVNWLFGERHAIDQSGPSV